jgi:methylglutaconyl-CoA hydratase
MIVVERRDPRVPWIILSRPDAMNALSGQLLDELSGAVRVLAKDPEVRAIVVTGAGEKAFSAGADLKERRGMTEEQTRARIDLINECFTALSRVPKLTIAALNGVAFGGGLELALACDLRLALPHVQLGLTEVRLGIMPGAGGTQRLSRLIGTGRAKELILLGRRLDAATAAAYGVVNRVVPDLAAAVEEMGRELDGCAPISIACAKRAIDHGSELAMDDGLKYERHCYEQTLTTADRNEGLAAFAEKRPPRYEGR